MEKILEETNKLEQATYDIYAGLEHIDTLNYYIAAELENILKGLKRTSAAPYLIDTAEKITKLGYIIDNEMKSTKENIEILLKQYD